MSGRVEVGSSVAYGHSRQRLEQAEVKEVWGRRGQFPNLAAGQVCDFLEFRRTSCDRKPTLNSNSVIEIVWV